MESRDQKNIEILRKLKQGIVSSELKEYSGWGGLRDAIYNPQIYRKLKAILNDAEINNIKETLGSAYFTPAPIIKAVYAILQKHGFNGGAILEPAAGHGAFIENMPADIKANSKISAVEIEQFSTQIIKSLYPGVKVYQQGFETLNFGAEFDLIVGNPPYSSKCLFDINHPDLKEQAIHHYFLAKSFRLLKKGGIVAMVLPNFCLDNEGWHVRDIIYKEGGRLLEAYRLPDSLFSNAKVTIDLVFIIKDRTANQIKWQNVVKYDEVAGRKIYLNEYFVNHPQNVLGELKVIDAYGRKLLTCSGDESVYEKLIEKTISESLKKEVEFSSITVDTFDILLNEVVLILQEAKEKITRIKSQYLNH